jgi:hypothetical protein
MKVKATRLGYYNNKRQPAGSVFSLVAYKKIVGGKEVVVSPKEQFSSSWMVEFKKDDKPAKGKKLDEESEDSDSISGDNKEVI